MLMSAAAFYRKVLGNGVGSSLCRSRTGTAFPSRVQVGTNYSTSTWTWIIILQYIYSHEEISLRTNRLAESARA